MCGRDCDVECGGTRFVEGEGEGREGGRGEKMGGRDRKRQRGDEGS